MLTPWLLQLLMLQRQPSQPLMPLLKLFVSLHYHVSLGNQRKRSQLSRSRQHLEDTWYSIVFITFPCVVTIKVWFVCQRNNFQARRALRALRGLVRLKSLIQGKCVRRQATSTLQSMQTLARLQYQIRERRQRLSEDKQACARQLQQKHNKDSDKVSKSHFDLISSYVACEDFVSCYQT